LLLFLFTNATLITPRLADFLAEWPPLGVEISIYGSLPETFEAVTRAPGSFAQCWQGIRLLQERGVSLTLKTMVMTLNRQEIWEMQNRAADLGVEFRFDPILTPRLDGSKQPCAFRLSPEEVVALDLGDEKRLQEWKIFLAKHRGPPEHPDYLYQCGAGVNSFHLDPYGNLNICLMARQPAYSLKRGSFKEGWQKFLLKVRTQKTSGHHPCGRCELFSLCVHCPGWAQGEQPEEELAYLCRLTHLRAEAFKN
jgi:radical SAM protein with 4Fe4S-binding SPASM domain